MNRFKRKPRQCCKISFICLSFRFEKKVLFVRRTRVHEDKQMTETSSTI